jgi:hypothetical protein
MKYYNQKNNQNYHNDNCTIKKSIFSKVAIYAFSIYMSIIPCVADSVKDENKLEKIVVAESPFI